MRTAKTLIRLDGAQADLSLRWAHRSFCWFCHSAAHMVVADAAVAVCSNHLVAHCFNHVGCTPLRLPVRNPNLLVDGQVVNQ